MKVIESAGGPLIGIHRAHLSLWSGAFGKKFFDHRTATDSDYDTLCSIVLSDPSIEVGKIDNGHIEVFFIASEPLPTLIIDAGPRYIYIAQIETSEKGWSNSQLCSADFERGIEWQQPIDFFSPGGEILFFDSACEIADVENDHLSSTLDEGLYTCEWAYRECKGKANLILIRMVKKIL